MVLAAPARPAVVAAPTTPQPAGTRRPRLHGIDLARGLAVIGMLFVDNRGSDAITLQLTHTPWNGLRIADVVFPVFLLIVCVTMPFSWRADRPRVVTWRVGQSAEQGRPLVLVRYGL